MSEDVSRKPGEDAAARYLRQLDREHEAAHGRKPSLSRAPVFCIGSPEFATATVDLLQRLPLGRPHYQTDMGEAVQL